MAPPQYPYSISRFLGVGKFQPSPPLCMKPWLDCVKCQGDVIHDLFMHTSHDGPPTGLYNNSLPVAFV